MSLRLKALLVTVLVPTLLAANTRADVPETVYETTISGYTIPHARDLVVADDGSAYVIGSAYEDGSSLDVLVAKISPAGKPTWTRYVVGTSHNYATDLALDAAGDVWVTGWTDSEDFPLVNPMDDSLTGFRDIFLMKLSATDGSILYSTFIGGDYTDQAAGIALNDTGEIYLTGTTGSTDFPVTLDAYQAEPSFPLYFFTDAFIMKLSPSGDQILYATYLGGLEDDEATRIVLDSNDDVIIAGKTQADDFPLVDPIQDSPNDLFVSKLSADGATLLFSSYFGGEDVDRLSDMTIDDAGNVYLAGSTRSVSFPTTPGAYAEDFVGAINGCEVPFGAHFNCEDFYVTKLTTDGSRVVWSTYLGGTRVDEGRSIAVDDAGGVYVAGYTSSDDFPMVDGDFAAHFLVSRLDATGSALDYTYSVESGSANRGNGVALDDAGNVYLSGTVGVPASIYVAKLGAGLVVSVGGGTVNGPRGLALAPNRPNPFNPTTTLSYTLPEGNATRVRLNVYDASGRLVRHLVDATESGGRHFVTWQGRNDDGDAVTSGIYFSQLEWEGHRLARRMVLVR